MGVVGVVMGQSRAQERDPYKKEPEMEKTIVGGRAYWLVDSIVFATREAALEYLAGK